MKRRNVLFVCTGNSARSVLAEAYLNAIGSGRFRAYSAGSHPAAEVNPFALELIQKTGIDASGLRPKSWEEFAGRSAPGIDLILTVCDNAADEVCPVWPGKPITAHWGVADPAAVRGSDDEKRAAFRRAFFDLSAKIDLLVALPIDELDQQALKARLGEIGASLPSTDER